MDQPRAFLAVETERIQHGIDRSLHFGTALDGEPGGLVDRDHVLVAVENAAADIGGIRRGDGSPAIRPGEIFGEARRYPDRAPGGDPGRGPGPPSVDPDLSGAQQLFQPTVA